MIEKPRWSPFETWESEVFVATLVVLNTKDMYVAFTVWVPRRVYLYLRAVSFVVLGIYCASTGKVGGLTQGL